MRREQERIDPARVLEGEQVWRIRQRLEVLVPNTQICPDEEPDREAQEAAPQQPGRLRYEERRLRPVRRGRRLPAQGQRSGAAPPAAAVPACLARARRGRSAPDQGRT